MSEATLIKPVFRFDQEKHEYWLGDKRLPGVSEILQAVGLTKDFSNVDPFYRERGIAGHRCIELYLKGELDESTVDPCLTGHFDGFRRFWDKHGAKPLLIESPLYNESYAGTVDLVTEGVIWDWKFSKAHDRVAELQGEGYKTLYGSGAFKVVQFPGDGTFELFDYGFGTGTWPHVLALYRWKKRIQ